MNFPNVIFTAGDYTVPYAVSAPEFSAPFPGVNVDYLLTQDWQMDVNSYTPTALNTPHPDFPDFVLTAEGNKRDIQGGAVRWTRTYAKVPDSYTEAGGNYSYNFIGYFGASQTSGTTTVYSYTGRVREAKNVPVQITREFFLIGPGQTYETSEAIPAIDATRYVQGTLTVDFVSDNPPLIPATTPSRTEYDALVTADAADPTSFSLVAEASRISRWQGNIFMRETSRIKAQ